MQTIIRMLNPRPQRRLGPTSVERHPAGRPSTGTSLYKRSSTQNLPQRLSIVVTMLQATSAPAISHFRSVLQPPSHLTVSTSGFTSVIVYILSRLYRHQPVCVRLLGLSSPISSYYLKYAVTTRRARWIATPSVRRRRQRR